MWQKHKALSLLYLMLLTGSLSVNGWSAKPSGSVCIGTTSKGKLLYGVRLPSSGPNYRSYSHMARLLGRTWVHSKVRRVVIDAYDRVGKTLPGKRFVYGETGYRRGGRFPPHKTHQNGLSVDFMMPVVNKKGKSVYLPTNVLNKWGYAIDFDSRGRYRSLKIDFEAAGAHLVALHKAARAQGIDLWRVLFAPDLQAALYKTRYGAYIRKHILIPKKRSWVRHDDHYHVDFRISCK